ncbi:Vacuolar sorting protein 9 (VPS9) domain [Teratosphaeria destructans]|uniref:Vacuolar sorting protein 9 (VPS9) domain n=1 Tax=Teratosphaeria destructans TaxID=418781 RepID=A0A9W7W2R7_9PEZI|nr:Vacuolar sorting protein 9 (VPS9) domain [Teratosphaeria destructans]
MAQRSASDGRPALPHVSRSFPRMPDSPSSLSPRKRASTLQDSGIPAVPEARHMAASPDPVDHQGDVFESREEECDPPPSSQPELSLPSSFDELPIEIRSLTERFVESLSAKVHDKPVTADALSELFQDFYERAAAHIATHIASLASRIGREKKPTTPTNATGRKRAGSGAKKRSDSRESSGGEMLTPTEIAERRKARRLLELKRTALEEAVERATCEKVYGKIYQHKSTDDEARDEKLRSRTAALALVGIGLKELHLDSDPAHEAVRRTAEEKEDEINASLADARDALQRMSDEHYPAGKLQHLTAAHKSIVETLSQLFPSSSSADEVLPTLIYTLITSPMEGINVVSNLSFIQRFRASSKVDGEAAYTLVNLEAAISFLETVDLSSLRADELPQGPPKSPIRSFTPTTGDKDKLSPNSAEKSDMLKPTPSPISVTAADTASSPVDAATSLPSPRTPTSMSSGPTMHQRRLSSLVQAQADRIEAGKDEFLKTADKIYDSINGTLENSLQFVFGRFKEQSAGDSPLPKTLEEARRLVTSSETDAEDILSMSGRSSPALEDPLHAKTDNNKMLEQLIGGRRQLRERSVDSTRSGGSGKRVAFETIANNVRERGKDREAKSKDDSPVTTPGAGPGAQAQTLFNAINPLNKFAMPSFAGRFSRSGSAGSSLPITPSSQSTPSVEKKLADIVETPRPPRPRPALVDQPSTAADLVDGEEMNAREALACLRKVKPPRKRFLEVQGAGELRLAEVEELLGEYRRLAKAIGEAVAL